LPEAVQVVELKITSEKFGCAAMMRVSPWSISCRVSPRLCLPLGYVVNTGLLVHFIWGFSTNTTSLSWTRPIREISRLMHARLKPFIIIDYGTKL
jgi:hypothetical protein